MAKKIRRPQDVTAPSPFEEARDELFQHIMRCGVIGTAEEHLGEWFESTMSYFAERFPELAPDQIEELRTLGQRFSQPPKASSRAVEPETEAASAA